uniref:DUF148 domain-containing protein n=1 Tax=Syphacia muris TaxID=451379 RepID=A0A0N5AHF2_9BILA
MAKIILLVTILAVVIISSDAGKRSKQEWDDYFKDESSGISYGCFVDKLSKDFNDFSDLSKKFGCFKKNFKTSNRARFPHHGHYKPHLHPFFANITGDDLKKFSQIILNRNLTKAELKTDLEKWANGLSSEAEQQFKKLEEHLEKMKQTAKNKTNEILRNVTSLFEKVTNIKDNMGITRGDERDQITAVFKKEAPLTVKIMRLIEKAAFQEARDLLNSTNSTINSAKN